MDLLPPRRLPDPLSVLFDAVRLVIGIMLALVWLVGCGGLLLWVLFQLVLVIFLGAYRLTGLVVPPFLAVLFGVWALAVFAWWLVRSFVHLPERCPQCGQMRLQHVPDPDRNLELLEADRDDLRYYFRCEHCQARLWRKDTTLTIPLRSH